MINVVIADDHPIVRAGLKQIITEETDIAVAAEAANGAQLLELVRQRSRSPRGGKRQKTGYGDP